jgi:hypothetical protein
MAKASVEDQLAGLAALGKSPDSPEARKQLRTFLASKINVVVSRAAGIVSHLADHDFNADLISAFHRFMVNPARIDKGCAAKTAVVKALLAAECDADEVFQIGIRHVQLEPTWGGRADTAAPLRALCGLGLVQSGSTDAIIELATLLADAEADARIGAASALGHCGPAATALLRFKVLTGDNEPAVIAECFNALMVASPGASFEFVARFVEPGNQLIYEPAALALAESRMPGVFDVLREKWTATFDREFKQTLLLPIALTRTDPSRDFLISLLESDDARIALAVIAALSIYRGDAAMRKRAEEAIGGPEKDQLSAALRRALN